MLPAAPKTVLSSQYCLLPFLLSFVRPLDTFLLPAATSTIVYAHKATAWAAGAHPTGSDCLTASSKKSTYDCHHKYTQLIPGPLVLPQMPSRAVGLSSQLLPCYTEPYLVERQITDLTHEISPVQPLAPESCTNTVIIWVKPYEAPTLHVVR